MFKKILIANRGEIACRVIKTAKAMGIQTVAVYSDADCHAMHVAMADEAVHIGAAAASDSYLQGERIIAAALRTGAEAIHPGYGFLSENAEFCKACAKNNIVFVGPPATAIEAMGSKSAAKTIMEQANVPLVPGYHGTDQNRDTLKQAADNMGYPVLLKAVAGGGGKGMRQVWQEAEFDQALAAAKREALKSFGNDDMLVEKYLIQPRHVEIQVFCDSLGNAVYLFERDCSVQRRHQKIIEEAPAPGISKQLRESMGLSAIRSAQAIAYEGAGTVEFLLDQDGSFYFMEMNTRLQVEHPVTEMITGHDLVKWQLLVAAGQPLPCKQEQLAIKGHAFEARVYAEDPDNDFLPVTGNLHFLQAPEENAHTRVDTGVRQGDEVSVYYDPMIAKLIVWGETRDIALQRLCIALKAYKIAGIKTNLAFLYNLANSKSFQAADLDTGFIEKHQDEIFHHNKLSTDKDISLAVLYLILQQQTETQTNTCAKPSQSSPWQATDAWQLNHANIQHFILNIHQQRIDVKVEYTITAAKPVYVLSYHDKTVVVSGKLEGGSLLAIIDDYQCHATISNNHGSITLFTLHNLINFKQEEYELADNDNELHAGGITAPMNGTVVTLLTEINKPVKKGTAIMVMEAMKMEHTINAPTDGVVTEFYFQAGDLIVGGSELFAFKAV